MRLGAILWSIFFLIGGEISAQQKGTATPASEPNASPITTVVPIQNVAPPAVPTRPNGKIQRSLVRITATDVEPDYKAPWNSGNIQRGIG
nr:hypothetical protein [Verrucomicrobiota bacterium]